MKILNITITNLASIENAYIDFEHGALSNCKTFLIAGPTGAGKTTILDAISLALYNKSSRMQGNRNEMLHEAVERIRKGCKQAEVILTITGNDNINYRITWSDKIIIRKGETKADVSQQIVNLQSGEIIGDTKAVRELIEQRIIGLDSEQFFRTTMLAQQEFTKFLKADDKNKSSILAKLSDTGKYDDIGKYINQQANDSRRNKETIEKLIENIQILSDEDIEQLTHLQQEAEQKKADESKASENLQHNIALISQLENNSKQQQQNNLKLSNLQTNYQQCLFMVALAQEEQDKKNKALQELQKIELQPIESYQKEISQLNEKQQQLTHYKSDIEKIKTYQETLDSVIKTVEDDKTYIINNTQKLKDAEKVYNQAVKEQDNAQNNYNKTFAEAARDLNKIRQTLQEGDICPVCGQKITKILSEGFFAEIQAQAKEDLNKAKQNTQNALQQYQTLKTEYDTKVRELQKEEPRIEKGKDIINKIKDGITKYAIYPEIKDLNTKGIKDYEENINRLIDENNNAIAQINKTISERIRLQQEIKTLSGQLTEAQQYKQQCIDLKPEYADLHPLEANYDYHFDSLFHTTASKLDDLLTQQKELLNSQTDIKQQLGNLTIDDKAALEQQLAEHQKLRDNAIELYSRISEQLSNNLKQQEQRQQYQQKLQQASHICDLWKLLNDCFGGPDGKNFQKIAQAHVMRYLLGKANVYLSQLTDRYSLTCEANSLRILVIDHDAGNQQRDAINLSGGESFIVSLALALGLSDLNANGLKVDTLFIDEGFGTLSSEPMQNAINTLLNLHKLQNGRKVGIISHIDALKENIHPQIIVKKGNGDNAPSTIEIEN